MSDRALEFLVICGQTASGKERTSLAVARRLDGEIVSLDSMKVYRGMDVGTAKASADSRRAVPHHLLDVVDPWESFSAARWAELAEAAIRDIMARGRLPIISGGTVLYLKALLFGLFEGPGADPEIRSRLKAEADSQGTAALHLRLAAVDPAAAGRIHPHDLRRIIRALEVYQKTGRPISEQQKQFTRLRPEVQPLVVGLRRTRDDLNRRIDRRVERIVAAGLEDEARRLLGHPRGLSREARRAVGYSEMIDFAEGRLSGRQAIERIGKNTRTFARRQMTHLRSLAFLQWIDVSPHEPPEDTAKRIVALWRNRPPPGRPGRSPATGERGD
ncbi:MAG: tRNA (adenosine(37)-N6)-dimethylallyltransferase MiaA [Anaerolineaceae bacterium]|nr:tRNA (adenosine(37)-N6)-dimethylallyltransferase MiaA [Anaerolineaceae bacterium]